MLIARGVRDAEVGQQTEVKNVFLKSKIFPLLSGSRAKSVSPEMWRILDRVYTEFNSMDLMLIPIPRDKVEKWVALKGYGISS